MIVRLEHVTFAYDGAALPVLRDVDLAIEAGELVLVAGPTGAGKSTLLRLLNGMAPRFTGGTLDGRVVVDGRATSDATTRELAPVVGLVGQDPLAGFVTDVVEDELAYGMEQLGVDPATMRRRVEETLDLLGIADLRRRALRTLSGGQQQRVAIGAVLTMHPQVLVLDEPTSALDPTAAEEVLATIARLAHDVGTTVLLAEHRLERVLPFVDRIALVRGDGRVTIGDARTMVDELPFAPPLVELARIAGWQPLPLTVREARAANRSQPVVAGDEAPARPPREAGGEVVLDARGVVVRHGDVRAVRGIDVRLRAGEVLALMGRNGAGKSSLLWALRDERWRSGGEVVTAAEGGPPALVPQTASDLLLYESVERELADADARATADPGTTRALLDELAPGIDDGTHPRDLSAGRQLALVLAMQLAPAPRAVLLDEPTRGLDYPAKAALARIVARLVDGGSAVVVATHDVEFAAVVATRAMVLADGEAVTEGDAAFVLAGSPAFAPQVAKVLGEPWLTTEQVRAAREAARA
jgi:energy-coupling factor transport system ATP-binding protein